MMEEVAKWLIIGLVSSTKFLFGLGMACLANIGFLPTLVLCVGSGMAGVIIYAYLQQRVHHMIRLRVSKKPKRKFTRFNKWLVKFKKRFGLVGIALLTPVFLQVPIGTFIAMHLIGDLRKVSLYMFLSFLLYTLVIAGLYYGLGIDVMGYIEGLWSRVGQEKTGTE